MESSGWITSDLDIFCGNEFKTYDHDEGCLNLKFLVNPLELDGVVPQLLIVLVPSAGFENTRGKVLWDRSALVRVLRCATILTGSLSCC